MHPTIRRRRSDAANGTSLGKRIVTLRSVAQIALGLVLAASALACGGGAGDQAPGVDLNGPGSTAQGLAITCHQDSDCKQGEVCDQNYCQMRRCSDSNYASQPPLPTFGYVQLDRELVVATGSASVQAVSGQGDKLELHGDKIPLDVAPADVAGGNLTGTRPEVVAYAAGTSVVVATADGPVRMDVGFQAKRLAVGDVDGDGVDEIAVAGGDKYAICSAVKRACGQGGTLERAADDVAVGDIDGDGFADVLFYGNHTLTVLNVHAGGAVSSQPVEPALTAITAGDLDGDGIAEVVGTEDGSPAFLSGQITTHVHVFSVGQGISEKAHADVPQALDVAFTRIGNKPRIGVLSSGGSYTDPNSGATTQYDNSLEILALAANALSQVGSLDMGDPNSTRVAAADLDGNSPMMRLKAGPTLQTGPVVPIAVITLPPYSATHSAGPSSATMGTSQESSQQTSQGTSQSVSNSVSLNIGYGVSAFGLSAWFSQYWTDSLSQTTSHSKSLSTSLSVGSSYSLTADPQVDGYNAGGVVLAGACYHQYDYAIDDPAGMLGESSNETSIFVPVGGDTTMWSARRYNALVEAIGNPRLPKVDITYKLGDIASYPTSPVTLDGAPIPDADNVFPNPPISRTSDVGTVGFSLSASQSTTNSDAASFTYSHSTGFSVGGSGGFNVFPVVNANANANVTWGHDSSWTLDQSYSVTIGTSTSFSGQVSPVRDDPSTPGNESTLYGYSFQPLVYRHHFKGKDGQDAAFYVLTYATGK